MWTKYRLTAVTLSFLYPYFCLDCLFRFSIYQDNFCLLSLIFLPGPPFQVFSPPRRSFLPKPPFLGFRLTELFFCFFLDKVFLDCISIHRMREFITIHGSESHSTARKASFDDVWAFVIRSLFAPRIWLKRQNLFKHKVAFSEFTRSDLFVKSFLHSSLI